MKIEDYSEYYIQGSDHYLIPKDEFVELFNKIVNFREETKELESTLELYENGVYFSSEVDEKDKIIDELKDNWNKLKEIAKSQSGFKKRADLKGGLWFEIDDLLDKMQELEQGSNE